MGYIAGNALDGSMVVLDVAMISVLKEVPTKTVLGEASWNKQDEKWRKANPVTTVVTTRQTPNQLETYFGYPILNVMYAMNQALSTQNSDGFVMIGTGQCYDTTELQALIEGDKEEIKERALRVPGYVGA